MACRAGRFEEADGDTVSSRSASGHAHRQGAPARCRACSCGLLPRRRRAGAGPGQRKRARRHSTAAELHRQGIPQVVAYVGSVPDRLATLAGGALYRALADGKRPGRPCAAAPARDRAARRVRPARAAARPAGHLLGRDPGLRWAQSCVRSRSRPPARHTGRPRRVIRTTQRRLQPGSPVRARRSSARGLIGRRRELAAAPRPARRRTRHVVQGLGGLGKSTFCAAVLDLYESDAWQLRRSGAPRPRTRSNWGGGTAPQLEARAKERWRAHVAGTDPGDRRSRPHGRPRLSAPAARLGPMWALVANLRGSSSCYLDKFSRVPGSAGRSHCSPGRTATAQRRCQRAVGTEAP